MGKLTELAKAESMKLDKLIERKKAELEAAPEGSLTIDSRRDRIQYYQHFPGTEKSRIYIKNADGGLRRALAQKNYDEQVLKDLLKRKAAITRFLSSYPEENIDIYYEKLCPERKSLVTPVRKPDEDYIRWWLEKPYAGLPFCEDESSSFYTKNGERVRSKSEIIIANTLFALGIPYKYECPLFVGNHVWHPDFTFLDVRTRSEVYMEHFGMMDKADYLASALNKLNTYQKNGFVLGKNLIVTFESSAIALDTRTLGAILNPYRCEKQ